MARIVPKLNLNKNPQVVENNSLVFAKNIKVTKDGTITRDDGISEVTAISNILDTGYWGNKLVGYIPYNTSIYLFVFNTSDDSSHIYKYDEKEDTCTEIPTSWHYSGKVLETITGRTGEIEIPRCTTKIEGEIIVNLNSDIILIISETGNDDLDIPIKYININRCTIDANNKCIDDESIYTQSPKIPFINLAFEQKYTKTIPNGVYQFFVRYEIKEGLYTNWFPCSKEIYSGTQIKTDTIQGTVQYVNVNSDSSESFIFTVHRLSESWYNYKSYQIGFILSHDDSTVARAWKHFNFNVKRIYFDYDTNYIEEVNIDDMLDSVYQIYNPKNITLFKNKIYISNYKESDINPDFSKYAQGDPNSENEDEQTGIQISFQYKTLNNNITRYYDNKKIHNIVIDSKIIFNYFEEDYEDDTQYQQDTQWSRLTKLFNKAHLNESIQINALRKENEDEYEIGEFVNTRGDDPGPEARTAINTYVQSTQNMYTIYDVKIVVGSDEYTFSNISWSIAAYDRLVGSPMNAILRYLKTFNDPNIAYKGFDINGYLYNQNNHRIDRIEFSFRRTTSPNGYSYTSESIGNNQWKFKVFNLFIRERYIINNLIDPSFFSEKAIQFDYQSLIPFKSYSFYVHYVKENGETTNGYFIKEAICNLNALDTVNGKLIYPTFSHIRYPEGYPYCFISIVDTNNDVAQIFNDNNCLDIDTLLLPINKNIKVYSLTQLNNYIANNPDKTKFKIDEVDPVTSVDYHYSGKPAKDKLEYFGTSGRLDINDSSINNHFIVQPNEKNEEYLALTKCTPYLNTSSFDNFNDMNLLGFVCGVYKPTAVDGLGQGDTSYYIASSDVYTKTVTQNMLKLTPNYAGIAVQATSQYIVYSKYNLNYLSLAQELSVRVMKKEITYDTSENSQGVGNTSSNEQTVKDTYLIPSFESLILSDIYELKSMYKDYRKKLFYPVETDTITIFNNTIRASEVHSDEGITYILKFNATQYYNVPTNKGYIVNLKAIADKILVHTQDSLFGFNGSSKLNTQNGNAQLSESDPFDTGITELFGSEHGFVGLENKNHTMISYDGYFFFDKDAKTIYNYTGQGLTLLSDPIERLLDFNDITDVMFADDYYNDRFFMLIKFSNNRKVNLSFNYKQKTFVSLHDFDYDDSISTKVNCYFIKFGKIFKVDKSTDIYCDDISFGDLLFPKIVVEDENHDESYYGSIIDVIYNNDFEKIKSLDAIGWIGSIVIDNFKSSTYFIVTEPTTRTDYSVDKLRIYSDSCSTELINVSQKDYHNTNKEDYPNKNRLNDYKLPSFNQGIWYFNYLRNIFNKDNPTRGSLMPGMGSDDRSLIYGKYFVIRFVFEQSTKFRLENVYFNVR